MKRVSLVVFWILSFAIISSAQTTFYFPHIADGIMGGTVWKTTIFLTNPAASGVASGTITLAQDNSTSGLAGSPFNITFFDETGAAVSAPITFSISAGQTKKYVSAGATPYGGGFATVNTTAGIVTGTSIFSEFANGQLIAEAGVPQAAGLLKQAIFVDTQGGYNIGVAYANPGGASATVTLSLLGSNAAVVSSTAQTLGPSNHSAIFTFQLFPTAPQLAGTMEISSTVPLAAIALRFDPTFSIFSTLPPISLSSVLYPAFGWLEERPWLAPLTSVARLLGVFRLRV
ncbi:MAG TPA: hypothetical protein VGK48_18920 [Terriglobia bacterium]|jgi:hypothetical protein